MNNLTLSFITDEQTDLLGHTTISARTSVTLNGVKIGHVRQVTAKASIESILPEIHLELMKGIFFPQLPFDLLIETFKHHQYIHISES